MFLEFLYRRLAEEIQLGGRGRDRESRWVTVVMITIGGTILVRLRGEIRDGANGRCRWENEQHEVGNLACRKNCLGKRRVPNTAERVLGFIVRDTSAMVVSRSQPSYASARNENGRVG